MKVCGCTPSVFETAGARYLSPIRQQVEEFIGAGDDGRDREAESQYLEGLMRLSPHEILPSIRSIGLLGSRL